MTKQEVLEALEALKDHTNHEGKQAIDGIKAGVMQFMELPLQQPVPDQTPPPQPKEEPTEDAPEEFVSGGRFAEKKVEAEPDEPIGDQEDEMKKEREQEQEVVDDDNDFAVHNKSEKPKAKKPKVNKPSPKKARK